jgi:hypothetical protein
MGNAEIRQLAEVPDTRPVVAPPERRVLWRVYCLRERGEKLPGDVVLRRSQVGHLRFAGAPDDIRASLIHPSGYPTLENLYTARLISGPHDRCGLKLAGTELVTFAAGDYRDVPQVWWCVVDSLGPG